MALALLARDPRDRRQQPHHSVLHAGQHNVAIALTKGFDRAFLIGACFALAGAALTVMLISSRDSRSHSLDARGGVAAASSRG